MKFVKFGSLQDIQDGDKFLVIAPNGCMLLCWWSKRGYFSPEVSYDLMQEFSTPEFDYEIPHNENTLVCKVEIEE